MKVLFTILILGIFALLFTMQSLQKERTGYLVAAVMEDIGFKEARNQYLRYKIGIYKSPDKILPLAQKQGFAIIDPQKIIVLEEKESEHKSKN